MLFSNILKFGFWPFLTTSPEEKPPFVPSPEHVDPTLHQKFYDIPQQRSGDNFLEPPTPQEPITQAQETLSGDTAVYNLVSGSKLGRIQLLHPVGTGGLFSFELLEGNFKKAWLTRETIQLAFVDQTVRSAHLAGYPADGCKTGLILIEQNNS